MIDQKKIIYPIIKVGFSFFIIFSMISSGKIDLTMLFNVINNPILLILCFFIVLLLYVPMSLRWYILLNTQNIITDFKIIFQLTFIGALFNNFLLGSMSGDIAKGYYISKYNPSNKTKAIISILVDRLIGLWSLLFLAAIALYFYSENLPQAFISLFNIIISLVIIIPATIILLNSKIYFIDNLKNVLSSIYFVGPYFEKLIKCIQLYWDKKRSLFFAIAISISIQSFAIGNFALLYKSLGLSEITMGQFFLIIPIVLVITAIPIAPMGIGVGQLAIYQLLTIVGVKNPAEGATLMTLYQSITICINFLGLFPYLKQGRKNEQPKFNIN